MHTHIFFQGKVTEMAIREKLVKNVVMKSQSYICQENAMKCYMVNPIKSMSFNKKNIDQDKD